MTSCEGFIFLAAEAWMASHPIKTTAANIIDEVFTLSFFLRKILTELSSSIYRCHWAKAHECLWCGMLLLDYFRDEGGCCLLSTTPNRSRIPFC
jgi:hypothetical protein